MARFTRLIMASAIAFTLLLGIPTAHADAGVFVGVQVGIAPPPLPVYAVPEPYAANVVWQPGYWAWGPYGYYWVPGTWVEAPAFGLLWTPGYWGWNAGFYQWNPGYWGLTVGFYGGIDYGGGYFGRGFVGGGWSGRHFRYNTGVYNVNRTVIRNTYFSRSGVVRAAANRVSFNGGAHGISARATAQDQRAFAQRRTAMTAQQQRHATLAQSDPGLRFSANHGRPAAVAAARPFSATNRPAMSHAGASTVMHHAAAPMAAHHAAAPMAVHHAAAPMAVHHAAAPMAVHHAAAPMAVHHAAAPMAVHHAAAPMVVHHAAAPPMHMQRAPSSAMHMQRAPAAMHMQRAPAPHAAPARPQGGSKPHPPGVR